MPKRVKQTKRTPKGKSEIPKPRTQEQSIPPQQLEEELSSSLQFHKIFDVAFEEFLGFLSKSPDFIEKTYDRFKNKELFKKALIKIMRLTLLYHSDEIDDFGYDPKFANLFNPFFEFLYEKYFRIKVIGIENVPAEGRVLMTANHSGTLPYDGAMLRISIKKNHPYARELRYLVEDFVYYVPFLGTFISRIGGVRACQENAERLLNQEHIVAVFPEGIKGLSKRFKHRYELQRFGRGGVIKLAVKTHSKVIPTAIIGAEEIHPLFNRMEWLARPLGLPYIPITFTFPWLGPLGLLPIPSKWTIEVGKPISYDHYTEADMEDSMLVNHLNESLRDTIQNMVERLVKERQSIIFG